MPNHVQNRLRLSGPKEQLGRALEHISSADDEGTKVRISFDRIIPMPKELNIQVHSGIEDCAKNALLEPASNNPLLRVLEVSNRLERTKSPLELKDDEWELFIVCLNNRRRHGHIYWYPWRIENWGTKWEAYSQPDDRDTDDTIHFQTAWATPSKVIAELSRQFPELTIQLDYADEDTGSNCGRLTFKAGAVINDETPQSQSINAYDLAFELWPEKSQRYKRVGDKYEYVEED